MFDIKIAEDVKDLLKDLSKQLNGEFDVYLGGGYLRDSYCGLTPKDVDVFLVPVDNTPKRVSYTPAGYYINYRKIVGDNNPELQHRHLHELVGLFNGKLSTPEVQFIVYDHYMDAYEVAEDLDMNINQVVWCPLKDILYSTQAFIKGHEDNVIECLGNDNDVRKYHRYERMSVKFPLYSTKGMPPYSVLPIGEQLQRLSGKYKPITSEGSFMSEREEKFGI